MKKIVLLPVLLTVLSFSLWGQSTNEGSEKSLLGESGPCLVVEVEG